MLYAFRPDLRCRSPSSASIPVQGTYYDVEVRDCLADSSSITTKRAMVLVLVPALEPAAAPLQLLPILRFFLRSLPATLLWIAQSTHPQPSQLPLCVMPNHSELPSPSVSLVL